MEFTDSEIVGMDDSNPRQFQKLVVEFLCGEKTCQELTDVELGQLRIIATRARNKGLDLAQFNELLLLLNQHRVGEGFFRYFFGKGKVKLKTVKNGIAKFRGFAMLCYGNIRYPFKQLMAASMSEIDAALRPYSTPEKVMRQEYESRPDVALEVARIDRDKTWYVGNISKRAAERESARLREIGDEGTEIPTRLTEDELEFVGERLQAVGKDIASTERTALLNTDVYLTWDHMDVYVATSMRNRWEFEETHDFISKVMSNRNLRRLKLRYFDPTQSHCANPMDKGLMEGLMLKRALCTIYMAQEYDTLGKDCELAATLAQRKPVIAYVPRIDVARHTKRIRGYHLDYFRKRYLFHLSEARLSEGECSKALGRIDKDYRNILGTFFREYEEYRGSQPFSLYHEKDEQFKDNLDSFSLVCALISTAERYAFDERAGTLKTTHPLALQVHLETGVANGVLVVRSAAECAKVLEGVLLNQLRFVIEREGNGSGPLVMRERTTRSRFRVVTNNEKLTNSFWNYYLGY